MFWGCSLSTSGGKDFFLWHHCPLTDLIPSHKGVGTIKPFPNSIKNPNIPVDMIVGIHILLEFQNISVVALVQDTINYRTGVGLAFWMWVSISINFWKMLGSLHWICNPIQPLTEALERLGHVAVPIFISMLGIKGSTKVNWSELTGKFWLYVRERDL